ncbi:MAG TPA: CapA family protein [Gemmatimonadales bacterium]|nr:CapA family protein [Gemmatimonadales bacterium]
MIGHGQRRRPRAAALAVLALRALSPLLPAHLSIAAASAAQSPDSAARTAPSVRLVFTGDINLGTRTLADGLPADSGRTLFAGVDSLLRGEFVIGNFEGVLSDTGESAKCRKDSTVCYAFATPTWLAPRLVEAGFTHLNLANNHANDYGLEARLHTQRVFDSLGLRWYGPLEQIVIQPVWVGETPVVVGLIGFATYPFAYNLLDLERSRTVVDSIRRYVDLLVVTFHGGREGAEAIRVPRGPETMAGEPRGDLRRWTHAVIDAGADAVVGHGPHVLRGVEFYRGKPVFYSLGNFATYRGFNLDSPRDLTAVLLLDLHPGGGFAAARLVSLRQLPFQGPVPDSSGAALRLVRRVTRQDFGATGARIGERGEVFPPAGIPPRRAPSNPPDPNESGAT